MGLTITAGGGGEDEVEIGKKAGVPMDDLEVSPPTAGDHRHPHLALKRAQHILDSVKRLDSLGETIE